MIRLEFLEEKDFEKIVEWNKESSSDDLLIWAGPWYKHPLTVEQIKEYFSFDTNKKDSDKFIYKIILNETNKMIGTIELGKIDNKNRSGRVGKFFICNEGVRGKGIGKVALKEVLKIGFDELRLHRISLGVFDFNESAIRCYEAVGFKKEGLLREVRKSENGYWDLYEMSILEDEWAKLGEKEIFKDSNYNPN
ncbi:MAG: GNAT family protein [Clostridiaceae bacterium]